MHAAHDHTILLQVWTRGHDPINHHTLPFFPAASGSGPFSRLTKPVTPIDPSINPVALYYITSQLTWKIATSRIRLYDSCRAAHGLEWDTLTRSDEM